ncbi:MAG: peptidoglycan editing factor PgeF [Rhodospirillales bacterium]
MMITADALTGCSGVSHGFFTRQGGVSEGAFASLNCGLGSGDDVDRVRANRARAMARIGMPRAALATARQVHSRAVAVVDAPWSADDRPQADGLVTRTRGVALGILTADCTPVLFADPAARVIGGAHAGWRGARAGILEATVAAMVDLGARVRDIVAAIGPCIRQDSYEVGAEFHAAFTADDPDSDRLFRPSARAGRYRFDLPGYVGSRLSGLSIRAVEDLPFDTFADEHRFFSYRRTSLNGGGDYGRALSVIALEP